MSADGANFGFLKLEDFLLPPPLPAILALLMALGVLSLARRAAKLLRKAETDSLDIAACFGLVAGALGCAIHLSALAGFLRVEFLRPLAWGLGVLGLIEIPNTVRSSLAYFRKTWAAADWISRVALAVTALALVALSAAALGPATDADSLDYHLGVPLDWLRHGGAYARADWLTARLAGIGESWNLIGLAGGTDGFGAAMQPVIACLIFVAVAQWATGPKDAVFGALLVFASPVLTLFVPNQKPQLICALATTVALVLAVKRRNCLDAPSIALIWINLSLAISCKHTALVSGGIVGLMALFLAWRQRRLVLSLAFAAVAFSTLVLPLYWRNAAFYGDPVWPLLTPLMAHGDPAAIGFLQELKAGAGKHSLLRLVRIPFEFSFTLDPTWLSSILGIGTFAVLAGSIRRTELLILAGCAMLTTALLLLFGQWDSRWFFEPYLWVAAGVVGADWTWRKRTFYWLLVGQGVIVLAMAIFAAVLLFPGALNKELRQRVMTKAAEGYADSVWLDGVLPQNARIITNIRSRALLPRPFVLTEAVGHILSQEAATDRLKNLLERERPSLAVVRYPMKNHTLQALSPYLKAEPFARSEFHYAARNPFWRGRLYQVAVFEITLER